MYYFLILELLQSNKEKEFSALEVYNELQKLQECQIRSINRMLLKMSLSHPQIHRRERVTPGMRVSINQPCAITDYVYFYRKF